MYYVIQVFSKKEDEIIRLMQTKISNDIVLDCFSPIRKRLKKFNGEWKQIIEKYFPGYIFIETNKPNLLFFELKKIPYFTKLLGKQKDNESFISLSEDEAKTICLLAGKETNHITEISDVYVIGKEIKIINGPLLGFEGKIIKVDLHRRSALVEVQMIGRKSEILLGIDILITKDD